MLRSIADNPHKSTRPDAGIIAVHAAVPANMLAAMRIEFAGCSLPAGLSNIMPTKLRSAAAPGAVSELSDDPVLLFAGLCPVCQWISVL
ncbi:unnamed protein product [Gongylonema pulchrum]|uniref:Uncharacterized protein n=1 Tax=Gongylonema pulchrum TaxID=637853 RepID=A0A183DZ40_9BILA|nr:unnamed protein product [Gongylonema pulchrum]